MTVRKVQTVRKLEMFGMKVGLEYTTGMQYTQYTVHVWSVLYKCVPSVRRQCEHLSSKFMLAV
jgi:hypothetical protein